MSALAYLTADATVSAYRAKPITPSDSLSYTEPTRGIYVGSSGDITLDMVSGGGPVLFVGMQGGIVYPFQVTRVYSTGTDATGLVALY